MCNHRLADEEMWTATLNAGAADCRPSQDARGIVRALRCATRRLGICWLPRHLKLNYGHRTPSPASFLLPVTYFRELRARACYTQASCPLRPNLRPMPVAFEAMAGIARDFNRAMQISPPARRRSTARKTSVASRMDPPCADWLLGGRVFLCRLSRSAAPAAEGRHHAARRGHGSRRIVGSRGPESLAARGAAHTVEPTAGQDADSDQTHHRRTTRRNRGRDRVAAFDRSQAAGRGPTARGVRAGVLHRRQAAACPFGGRREISRFR